MLVSRDSATNALENSVIDGVSGRVAFWMWRSSYKCTGKQCWVLLVEWHSGWVSRDLATNALENSVIDGVSKYIYSHHPMHVGFEGLQLTEWATQCN